MAKKSAKSNKLFVLDTNVLLHDPTCLYRFQEHDIYLPMATLEELDHNKKGMSEVSRNARQVSRFLDEIVSACELDIADGAPLAAHSHNAATGRLILQTHAIVGDAVAVLPHSKVDNQILGVVSYLKAQQPSREVVLVSKDINLRIKAAALNIPAEDYQNDQVLEDLSLLYSGQLELPAEFWDQHSKELASWKEEGRTYYRISGPDITTWHPNQLVHDGTANGFEGIVRRLENDTAVVELCVA
mgnify:CR=1 FL=1